MFKDKEFENRNWLRRSQSPQSPLFNVNDLFYFRKLSKEISAEQSLNYGTRVLKCEEIIKIVEDVLIEFNKEIVSSLEKQNCKSQSLHSKENNIISVEKDSEELGFVGSPTDINKSIVDKIIKNHLICTL